MAAIAWIEKRWVRYSLIAIILVAVMVAGFVWALTGPLGRAVLAAAADGRSVAGYGELAVARVEGNILSEFSIGELELRDQDGVWLRAHDIAVAWDAASALGDRIEIRSVSIASAEVLRRPVREPAEPGGAAPAVVLSGFDLVRLRVASEVFGPQADYAVRGRFETLAQGALTLGLDLARVDRAGDVATLALARTSDGTLSGEIAVSAPPGGALAELARLTTIGWSLDGVVSGTVQTGAGEFAIQVGENQASSGMIAWTDGGWDLEASLDPRLWTELPAAAHPLVADMALTGRGATRPFSVDRIEAQTRTLRVGADEVLSDQRRAEIVLEPDGAALLDGLGVEVGSGRIDIIQQGPGRYGAEVQLDSLTHPALRLQRLVSRMSAQRADDGFTLSLSGEIEGAATSEPRVDALLGDPADFEAMLRLSATFDAIALQSATVRGADWRAVGAGAWDRETNAVQGDLALNLADIAPLGFGVTGPLSVSVRSDRDGEAPGAIIEARSDGFGGPATVQALLGPLEADARVEWSDGVITLPAIRVQTAALAVEAQAGQSAADGRWFARGDYAVDLAAFQTAGFEGRAIGAFEAETLAAGLAARTQLETGALIVGGARIDQPQARIEAEIQDGRLLGNWRIDARARDQALQAEGRFERASQGLQLVLEAGVWGRARATGAVALNNGVINAELSAADDTRGGAWAAELSYGGPLASLRDGDVRGRLAAQDWAIPAGHLAEALVTFDGPLSQLPLEATASGTSVDAFALRSTGMLAFHDQGFEAELDLDGDWLDGTIRANSPVRIALDDSGVEADADISLGDARLQLSATRSQVTQISARVAEAPAQLVTYLAGLPDAAGRWSVDIDLARAAGAWRGAASLTLADVRPADQPDDGALTGEGRLSLGDAAAFAVNASAGGLEAVADLTRSGPITDLGHLLDPGWRGSVALTGPLDTLSGLYLPSSEVFLGHIDGRAQFSAGEVSGDVAIRDGVYMSQTTGVNLSPFTLTALFADDQLRVTNAQLGDGAGGVANGTGAMRLTQDGLVGEGEISFERFRAVSRPDLSVEASGTALLALNGRRLAITGESDLDRLELTPVQSSGLAIAEIEVEEINRPESLDPPYRRPILIDLDYRVRADDALFVSSRAFTSEWAGDVQVVGPVNRLTLNGEVHLLKGQGSLFTRIFRMEEGRISFAGPLNRTRLLLSGTHQRAGLTVNARAEGSIRQPQIEFSSDPSLPEDEILARLLFDQDATALSPLQTAQLAAQLSGRNWLGALSEAGRWLGVDRLDVRDGEDGRLTLVGGRQIGENLYLELETGSEATFGAARIEWSITPDIFVLSRLTGDTDGELAIRWRREFE
jgi:autotransporter translocation and assembly factor TamB